MGIGAVAGVVAFNVLQQYVVPEQQPAVADLSRRIRPCGQPHLCGRQRGRRCAGGAVRLRADVRRTSDAARTTACRAASRRRVPAGRPGPRNSAGSVATVRSRQGRSRPSSVTAAIAMPLAAVMAAGPTLWPMKGSTTAAEPEITKARISQLIGRGSMASGVRITSPSARSASGKRCSTRLRRTVPTGCPPRRCVVRPVPERADRRLQRRRPEPSPTMPPNLATKPSTPLNVATRARPWQCRDRGRAPAPSPSRRK